MKVAVSPVLERQTPVLERQPEASSIDPVGLPAGVDLLQRLEGICVGRGLPDLAARLEDMVSFIGLDLASFEAEFAGLPRRPQLVGRSATHLLDLGGKRLRPLCLTLSARLGSGFDSKVLDLAVAVELVHSATLLHDDVVDASDSRRGRETARASYGNAASIFAGDWLLIEALRRVQRSAPTSLLTGLFDTIEEMIFAESLQLENRGRLGMSRDDYFRVVEGKTASVFRWAMQAGAVTGGLNEAQQQALASYGLHLGIAFQAVDDLLDLTGEAVTTGKQLFTDLREGKMTLPLIFALERSEKARPLVEQTLAHSTTEAMPAELAEQVIDVLRQTRAVEDCLEVARDHGGKAIGALDGVPPGRARNALETIAEAIIDRDL